MKLVEVESWSTISDAPPWVRECASLLATVPGLRTDAAARFIGRTKDAVEAALSSEVVQEYMSALQISIVQRRSETIGKMTDLRERAINRCIEVIDEAEPKDAVAIAKMAMDYHPDRELVRMEKRQESVTHTHKVSGELLNTLKQRHLEITNSANTPIEIEAEVLGG